MKRTMLAAAVAVAALVSITPAAHAQMASPLKFGISGGADFPTGDFGKFTKTGYNITGHLGFQAPVFPLGLRVDAGWNQFSAKGNTGGSNVGVRILSGTLNAVVQPAGMIMAKPYVIGGVGVYNARATGRGTSGIKSETNFGLNGGAGVSFGLAGFSTFAEARYHYIFDGSTTNGVKSSGTAFVPLSFGIMF